MVQEAVDQVLLLLLGLDYIIVGQRNLIESNSTRSWSCGIHVACAHAQHRHMVRYLPLLFVKPNELLYLLLVLSESPDQKDNSHEENDIDAVDYQTQ